MATPVALMTATTKMAKTARTTDAISVAIWHVWCEGESIYCPLRYKNTYNMLINLFCGWSKLFPNVWREIFEQGFGLQLLHLNAVIPVE